mmetsp:Transcript_1611/g.3518  ORF Transcript_1611/g.3518 Transcript_1611/m.3518 type:complete len:383 (-) Transcript_1611:58-1206(-)
MGKSEFLSFPSLSHPTTGLTANVQSVAEPHEALPVIQLGREVERRAALLSPQLSLQHALDPPGTIHAQVHLAPRQVELGPDCHLRLERDRGALEGGHHADATGRDCPLVVEAEHALSSVVGRREVGGRFRTGSGGGRVGGIPVRTSRIVDFGEEVLGGVTAHHVPVSAHVHPLPPHRQSWRDRLEVVAPHDVPSSHATVLDVGRPRRRSRVKLCQQLVVRPLRAGVYLHLPHRQPTQQRLVHPPVDGAPLRIHASHHEPLLVVHLRREAVARGLSFGEHSRPEVEGVHHREERRELLGDVHAHAVVRVERDEAPDVPRGRLEGTRVGAGRDRSGCLGDVVVGRRGRRYIGGGGRGRRRRGRVRRFRRRFRGGLAGLASAQWR